MGPCGTFRLQGARCRIAGGRWLEHRWIVGFLLALLLVPEAWGSTLYVSKSGVDNAACSQAAPCRSIRHAVSVANPGDTISIGAGKFLEAFGVTIDKNLVLDGTGAFITRVWGAFPGFSIFRVLEGATVTITDLDVMSGNAYSGGGIANLGTLTLERVRIWKNSAVDAGGGIMNWGTLVMNGGEIAHNSASGIGGSGLHNHGSAELNEVRIVKNYSDAAMGGIWNSGSDSYLVVDRSEVSHNEGNGITNWSGTMFLSNTTVSRNHRRGIHTVGVGYTKLIHVTVAENGIGSNQHSGPPGA